MQNKSSISFVVGTLVIVVALVVAGVQHMQKVKEGAVPAATQTPTTQTQTQPPTTTATAPKPTTTSTATSTSTTTTNSGPKAYSATEVASHDSRSSCWTIVNGNVYDLTSWISKHPGGSGAILGMCGSDASDAFNEQHGGQGGPERVLASYKIGILK